MLSSQQNSHNQQAYQLRYEAYLDKHSIKPNDTGTFTDPYDDQANCTTHVEYIEGMPAGSIRACVYSPFRPDLTIPAQELFPAEVESSLDSSSILVESNKFVVHPLFQNKTMALKFKLFRYIFDVALNQEADYMLTSPRATQTEFYERILFKPISGIKKSLELDFDVVLMACDLRVARDLVRKDKKYAMLRRFGLC